VSVAGQRHQVTAETALWLSALGLGACEVLAIASNDWVDQQSTAGLREWHRALEEHATRRSRRREEVA
jgi:hypothetical protein